MSDVQVVTEDGKIEMIDYRAAFLRAEKMLMIIDELCSPNTKGHIRRDAIKHIQSLVMTRPWKRYYSFEGDKP